MRWTDEQKGAKVLRDHFGEPPPRNTNAFDQWAEVVAEYIDEHPPPLPRYGARYLLDGDKVGTYIGPVPDRPDSWVFQVPGGEEAWGHPVYEEHGRDSILDDYEAWRADQEAEQARLVVEMDLDEDPDDDPDDAPELWVGPGAPGADDEAETWVGRDGVRRVSLEGYAGPNTDALETAEHSALDGPPPPPVPLRVEQGGEQ